MRQNDQLTILTGGPGVGKTSLLNALAGAGYGCVPEVARVIIVEEVEKGGNALPWGDTALYTSYMLERSLADYLANCNNSQLTFFDRGLPDTLAYARLIGLEMADEVEQVCTAYRYDTIVFLLPFWEEIYCRDNERKQSVEEAMETDRVMRETYLSLGYRVVEVPRVPVAERVAFILRAKEAAMAGNLLL